MIFIIGAALSAGFYAVGLDYWLLAGGFVSLVEIVPVIGPLVGAIFVVAIALPQKSVPSQHSVWWSSSSYASSELRDQLRSLMGRSSGCRRSLPSCLGVGGQRLVWRVMVVLADAVHSAVATLIDVFVRTTDPPAKPPRRSRIHQRFRARPDGVATADAQSWR
jgi:hypothetical protein